MQKRAVRKIIGLTAKISIIKIIITKNHVLKMIKIGKDNIYKKIALTK